MNFWSQKKSDIEKVDIAKFKMYLSFLHEFIIIQFPHLSEYIHIGTNLWARKKSKPWALLKDIANKHCSICLKKKEKWK